MMFTNKEVKIALVIKKSDHWCFGHASSTLWLQVDITKKLAAITWPKTTVDIHNEMKCCPVSFDNKTTR